MSGPYHSIAVANSFLQKAEADGRKLTLLQLVKLPYIAHGWHLAATNEPLLNELVQAWQYGPVVANVYHEFKKYGSDPILEPARDRDGRVIVEDFDSRAELLLSHVWKRYRDCSGAKLIQLTHLNGSPWSEAYEDGVRFRILENDKIKKHYVDLLDRAEAKTAS